MYELDTRTLLPSIWSVRLSVEYNSVMIPDEMKRWRGKELTALVDIWNVKYIPYDIFIWELPQVQCLVVKICVFNQNILSSIPMRSILTSWPHSFSTIFSGFLRTLETTTFHASGAMSLFFVYRFSSLITTQLWTVIRAGITRGT